MCKVLWTFAFLGISRISHSHSQQKQPLELQPSSTRRSESISLVPGNLLAMNLEIKDGKTIKDSRSFDAAFDQPVPVQSKWFAGIILLVL